MRAGTAIGTAARDLFWTIAGVSRFNNVMDAPDRLNENRVYAVKLCMVWYGALCSAMVLIVQLLHGNIDLEILLGIATIAAAGVLIIKWRPRRLGGETASLAMRRAHQLSIKVRLMKNFSFGFILAGLHLRGAPPTIHHWLWALTLGVGFSAVSTALSTGIHAYSTAAKRRAAPRS